MGHYFGTSCILFLFFIFHSHKTDSADNCLIECHECHNYYHQICHKPPMTNKDIHDPRFLWYCTQCSRRMKKEMVCGIYSSFLLVVSSLLVVPSPDTSIPCFHFLMRLIFKLSGIQPAFPKDMVQT